MDIERQILTNVCLPDKVIIVSFGYKDFYLIQSKNNENDLLNWFRENGKQLEKNLEKLDYSWCYIFEIDSSDKKRRPHPCIYMAIGEGVCQFTVTEFLRDEMKSAPEGIHYELIDDSISTVDLSRFYTPLENFLMKDMFTVKDPSACDIDNYHTERIHVRHLKDEIPSTDDGSVESGNDLPSPPPIIPPIYPFVIKASMTEVVVNKILSYLEGKIPSQAKEVMMPIRAAQDAGVVGTVTYSAMKSAFPEFCPNNKSSVSKYTRQDDTPYTGEAFKAMVEDFKSLLNNRNEYDGCAYSQTK